MLIGTSPILLFLNNLTCHCQLGCESLTSYIQYIQVLGLFKHKQAWKSNDTDAYVKLVLLILKYFGMFSDCLSACINEIYSLFV